MKSVPGTMPTFRNSEVDETEVPVFTKLVAQQLGSNSSRGNSMSRSRFGTIKVLQLFGERLKF